MVQIPIANTGSLPDLTNVDFPSPIHAPLDQDHDSSPYSSVSTFYLQTPFMISFYKNVLDMCLLELLINEWQVFNLYFTYSSCIKITSLILDLLRAGDTNAHLFIQT